MLGNVMVVKDFYSLDEVALLLNISKSTLRRWDKDNKLTAIRNPINNYREYSTKDLLKFEAFTSRIADKGLLSVLPQKKYTSIELFAGAGGLALGLEKAGLNCVLLNEIDHWAAETLRQNRTSWNVIEKDVRELSLKDYYGKVDVVTGGFPCQAFSYAGKKLGLEDARGTLFYEFARIVKEVQPKICIGENVRGLLNHANGKTLEGMISVLDSLGYNVLEPRVLKAIHYKVPQKRERLIIAGIRKDLNVNFQFPIPYKKIYTLKDALKKGDLFNVDVPDSKGAIYPLNKQKILALVPPGGYWRDLPLELQKEYMKKSFYLGGGKTGMARKINWNEPCLTLTCSPAQKQTERCHPEENRPFTVREYARIQTFPDDWQFSGSLTNQYKQIGNAVPVNLAYEIGTAIIRFLNQC